MFYKRIRWIWYAILHMCPKFVIEGMCVLYDEIITPYVVHMHWTKCNTDETGVPTLSKTFSPDGTPGSINTLPTLPALPSLCVCKINFRFSYPFSNFQFTPIFNKIFKV